MNAHQALRQSVGKILLAQVFNNTTDVNLFQISDSGTAGSKLNADTRPTFDTNLRTNSSGGLYTKTTQAVFPRAQAEQIARSHAVLIGILPANREYDTTLNFNENFTPVGGGSMVQLPEVLSFNELVELNNLVYLIDITWNNNTRTYLSTYDRDLTVNDGFYGNPLSSTRTYISNSDLIELDETGNNIETGIRDGLVLSANTAGLLNNIQNQRHINGKILIRGIGVKDGNILFGPVRLAGLAIDGAQHNIGGSRSTVTLSTIKNWDQIKNPYGSQTSNAVHKSFFPNDNFFKYAADIQNTKLWKEND